MGGELGQLRALTVGDVIRTYGSDSGSSLSKHGETRKDSLDAGDTVRNLLDVSRELLAECEGSGVLRERRGQLSLLRGCSKSSECTAYLEVSATDLNDVVKGLLLSEELGVKLLEGWDQGVGNLDNGRDVHSSGEAERSKQRLAGRIQESLDFVRRGD